MKGGGAIKVASEEPASSSVHYLGNHQHRPPWAAQVTKQGITPQKPLKTLTTPHTEDLQATLKSKEILFSITTLDLAVEIYKESQMVPSVHVVDIPLLLASISL